MGVRRLRMSAPLLVVLIVVVVMALTASGCSGTGTAGSARAKGPSSARPSSSQPSPAARNRSATAHRPSFHQLSVRALWGRTLTRLPTRRKVVALTFDGGANDAGAAAILAALKKAGVTATFTLTGRWVSLYPKFARYIGAHYTLANHTYDHRDLTTLPDAEVKTEVLRAQRLITRATGRNPKPLFRFPYGAYDDRVLHIVNALGYVSIGWTTDTLGWEGTSGGQSVGSVFSRVLGDACPGQIVLMHLGSNPEDGSTLDADALPWVITALKRRGYGFVSVADFIKRSVNTHP